MVATQRQTRRHLDAKNALIQEFDKLKTDWIRHKGYIQMKMISEKEDGGKLSSWKVYYAVLSNGFLLLYKEGHVKSKVGSQCKPP